MPMTLSILASTRGDICSLLLVQACFRDLAIVLENNLALQGSGDLLEEGKGRVRSTGDGSLVDEMVQF